MQKEPTTDEIVSMLEDVIKEKRKGDEYCEMLETHVISQLFYLFHTFDYKCRTTALKDLKAMTAEVHDKLEEFIDRIEDPYEEEIKKQA